MIGGEKKQPKKNVEYTLSLFSRCLTLTFAAPPMGAYFTSESRGEVPVSLLFGNEKRG